MFKRILIVFFLILPFIFLFPLSSHAAGDPSLVASYGFNEGSGNTLYDLSGNFNNGTLTNGPNWFSSGKFGKSLKFDGTNDLVIIPNSTSINFTNAMTLEAWVNPSANLSGWDSILMKERMGNFSYALFANTQNSNRPSGQISQNGIIYKAQGGQKLPKNVWAHLAATYEGSSLKLYINGNLVSAANLTGLIDQGTGNLIIGGSTVLSPQNFPGKIDEVRIYNRALVQTEIVVDMQTPVTLAPTVTPTPTTIVTPTHTPTPSAIPTSTPTPTLTPSPSPTPTAIPTMTPTVVPTSIPSPSPTPTSTPTNTPSPTITPTIVPPTSTPTPTLQPTAIPTFTPTPLPFVGLGIMGDSMSDEYRADDNRGGTYSETTKNWMELLVVTRAINVGTWGNRSEPRRSGYEYNWARSGARVSDLLSQGQAAGLASQISGGSVSHVYIMAGFNDFAAWNETYNEIYNGTLNGSALQNKIDTLISDMSSVVDTLQNAGPVKIVMANIIDKSPSTNFRNRFPDSGKRQLVTNAINSVNAGLEALSVNKNIKLHHQNEQYRSLWLLVDQNGFIPVGGESIDTLHNADEPHHFILGDNGHEGTVIQGTFANSIIDSFNSAYNLGIVSFSDTELLLNAGIISPTVTPTATQPTSTPLPSPTPTSIPSPTPTPTLTPSPIPNLLGYWKMNENTWVGDCSTPTVIDSSGNGKDGKACRAGDAPSPVAGLFGNAGLFDGIYEYANMGPGFNFTSSFTTTYWAALDNYDCGPVGSGQHLIGTHHNRKPNGNGRGWGMYWDCSGIAWELTNSDGSAIGSYGYYQPSPYPVSGSWHHFALVYNSAIPDAYIYFDGLKANVSKVGTVPSFLFNNYEPLTVNGLPYASSAGAPGKMDEVRVYNRALNDAEIASIYSGSN